MYMYVYIYIHIYIYMYVYIYMYILFSHANWGCADQHLASYQATLVKTNTWGRPKPPAKHFLHAPSRRNRLTSTYGVW